MRWLQWSTIDLQRGVGGVEVHARSIARELMEMGIETGFSMDPKVLSLNDPNADWDVIHTHGSAVPLFETRGVRGKRPIRVHTLHGTTLGRMAACGEWFWPGGYLAAGRELSGVVSADVVLSVHPNLSLYHLAKKLGKTCVVCWNGWDASPRQDSSNGDRAQETVISRFGRFRPFWLFIGRGGDRMKAADRLLAALPLLSDFRLLAAPGDGFESNSAVIRTGVLSSAEISALLEIAQGMILPSRYEGNSLVVLEALAQGIPVVATRVGGVGVLPTEIEGLVICDSARPTAITTALEDAKKFAVDERARHERANKNRSLLHDWKKVASIAVAAVQEARHRKGWGGDR